MGNEKFTSKLALYDDKSSTQEPGGGYLSRKVTGVCSPENKKPTHPPIFFPGLRPISTDFFPVLDPYLQIFDEHFPQLSRFLMIICMFLTVFHSFVMITDSPDDS